MSAFLCGALLMCLIHQLAEKCYWWAASSAAFGIYFAIAWLGAV